MRLSNSASCKPESSFMSAVDFGVVHGLPLVSASCNWSDTSLLSCVQACWRQQGGSIVSAVGN